MFLPPREALFIDFWLFFEAFGSSKIASKSSSMRLSEKRKNLKKCHRVASKSRFAGPAVDAKMSLRSDLRPAKNASSANRRKSQIFDRFLLQFGSILGAKIDSKSDVFVDWRWNRFLHVSSCFLSSCFHQRWDLRTSISKRPYSTF